MSEELTPTIKKALILLGKIQYLKKYDKNKKHLLGELVREYIKQIEPELLRNRGTPEADEIATLFEEHATEEERKISGELDFFDAVSKK